MHVIQHQVSADQDGQRLDNLLFTLMRDCPKSRIYRAIRSGEVRVNGQRCRPMRKLCEGDMVRVPLFSSNTKKTHPKPLSESVKQAILYEDDVLFVLNKPAGIAVHGGQYVRKGLIDTLMQSSHFHESAIHLVHRLDKATSGVMILTKTRQATVALTQQFQKRHVKKQYVALVYGHIPRASFEMCHFMMPTKSGGQHKMMCCDTGQSAKTHVEVMQHYVWSNGDQDVPLTYLSLRPETGRKHQLRCQLHEIGHPIVSDALYFTEKHLHSQCVAGLPFFLHASRVAFKHPATQQSIEMCAPLPKELQQCLNSLKPIH